MKNNTMSQRQYAMLTYTARVLATETGCVYARKPYKTTDYFLQVDYNKLHWQAKTTQYKCCVILFKHAPR